MARASASLDEILEIRRVGDDVFSATLDGYEGRSFGGQTLGCATRAAASSCGGRALHALHTCFLRPVPAEVPIELHVERLRDGRRFSHRRVQVRSGERLLCELMASFTVPGRGAEYQDARPDATARPPEELPPEEEVARAAGWVDWEPGPFEMRWIGTPWQAAAPDEPSRYLTWVRPRHALGADPGLHAAAAAYLSDFHSHWPVARRLGGGALFEPAGYVSLDQLIWLHRDCPWEDWRLVSSESDVAHGGRALSRRQVHTREGELVASMAQEALIPDPPSA